MLPVLTRVVIDTLILDIGSSNTWVGARGFDYPPSSVYTGETVVSS